MKRIQQHSGQLSHGVSLRTEIISGVCVAALLFGAIAQSMPASAQQNEGNVRDAPSLYADFAAKQYAHNANGSHVGAMAVAGNERREYDVLGRLTRYEGPEGVEEYTYLGASHKRRTVKRTPAGSTTPELTTFLYDGNNVVAEFTGDNHVLSKTYVTTGLDDNLSMTVHNGPNPGTYYYTQDGLGSVRHLTDSSGIVRNAYDYTAFGEPYNTTVAVNQPYGYTGRETNPLSGDMHYRFRNYNPALGRFDTRDPIGYRGGVNQYAYVGNMPYSYTDPFGLKLRVVGDPPFRKKILDSLNEICSGLTMDDQGNVAMNYCPSPDDGICNDWYEIIHNDQNNIIRVGNDRDRYDAATISDPYKGIIGEDGMNGPNSDTEVYIKDKDQYVNRWGQNQFDVPATIILPQSVILSHELGHVHLLNKGAHPNRLIDVNQAEEHSMKRENDAWERIGSGYVRKHY